MQVAVQFGEGDRRRQRLVQDSQQIEAGDLSGFERGIALRLIEARRHGQHHTRPGGNVRRQLGANLA